MVLADGEQIQLHQIHLSMMDARRSGDPDALQRLFRAGNIEQGDAPVQPRADLATSPAPITVDLLADAVANRHTHVVVFLLSTYANGEIVGFERILHAAFRNPQLETSTLLHAHQPDDLAPPPIRAVAEVLSDACHGGQCPTPRSRISCSTNGAAASEATGGGGQPLSLIRKMVSKKKKACPSAKST